MSDNIGSNFARENTALGFTGPDGEPFMPHKNAEDFGTVMHALASTYDDMSSQWRRSMGRNAHESLAINALWISGPLTMGELSRRIPLSRAAVTTLIDRLEEDGYVKRVADVDDRRRTTVVMTDKAYYEVHPLVKSYHERIEKILNRMTDEQWEFTLACMQQMMIACRESAAELRSLSDEKIQSLRGKSPNEAGAFVG